LCRLIGERPGVAPSAVALAARRWKRLRFAGDPGRLAARLEAVLGTDRMP
jgi:hypothetical protein